jgi:alpha 1,2-mannosyltransferase
MLIDKRARGGLNLVALEIARAMQEDEEFWFRLSGGDKDTFVSIFKAL